MFEIVEVYVRNITEHQTRLKIGRTTEHGFFHAVYSTAKRGAVATEGHHLETVFA